MLLFQGDKPEGKSTQNWNEQVGTQTPGVVHRDQRYPHTSDSAWDQESRHPAQCTISKQAQTTVLPSASKLSIYCEFQQKIPKDNLTELLFLPSGDTKTKLIN